MKTIAKTHYVLPDEAIDPHFQARLAERKQRLVAKTQHRDEASAWQMRSYPVLAVLAPVMATHEEKIEFPGDPMALYSALSVAVDQVVKARAANFGEDDPYNDLCPQWGIPPTPAYRLAADDSGIRDYAEHPLNIDQTVFDPRVWNERIKAHFVTNVLEPVQPRVVLISTVSPGHRYAIDIARTVRRYVPDALIVLGGRHIDETMRYQDNTQQLELAYSSTLQAIEDGRIENVIDFLLSGDGYFSLDLLMKAISIAMDLDHKTAQVADVIDVLDHLAPVVGPVGGHAVIVAVDGADNHVYPIRGRRIMLSEQPSPYRYFAIRARFPIFESPDDGHILRTGHTMVTNACPYHCNYCSEGRTVTERIHLFARDPMPPAIELVCEYVSYGAESLFFDDSIFWGGNIGQMRAFCEALSEAQAAAQSGELVSAWLQSPADFQRLVDLQWGAQLTIEFLATIQTREAAMSLLVAMRDAGCTYIYIGLESLSAAVMSKIHKNIQRADGPTWAQKIVYGLELAHDVGIRMGASVLFGLDGETRETVEATIDAVARLIDNDLLYIASPNILTYHPGTEITRKHNVEDSLDYHSEHIDNKPPYVYFEEAFPGVVSRELSEEDIWYIHRETQERWGSKRNQSQMVEPSLPPEACHPA